MTTWHLTPTLAEQYADGLVSPTMAASVEQHLMGCADCRALLVVDAPRLDRVWDQVLETVQAPAPGWFELLLRRTGLGETNARLLALTPALRGGWTLGVLVVLVVAVLVSHASPRGESVFVVLAPILPLAGVALSFTTHTDPSLEMASATPFSPLRLLAVRAALVLSTSLVPAVLLSPLVSSESWPALVWLLPSLAMAAAVLALADRIAPAYTALGLWGLWFALTAPRLAGIDPLAAEYPWPVQALSATVLAVALTRLSRLDLTAPLRRTP